MQIWVNSRCSSLEVSISYSAEYLKMLRDLSLFLIGVPLSVLKMNLVD
jgi:hypothetical protein